MSHIMKKLASMIIYVYFVLNVTFFCTATTNPPNYCGTNTHTCHYINLVLRKDWDRFTLK